MIKNYFPKLSFVILLLLSLGLRAQVNEVLKASQFGGVSNISYNPAIADNRFLVDINLLSAGFGLENNYVGLDPKTITHHDYFNDPNFQDRYLRERLNGNVKRAFVGMQVQGPLSFHVLLWQRPQQ